MPRVETAKSVTSKKSVRLVVARKTTKSKTTRVATKTATTSRATGTSVDVYDLKGKVAGKVTLPKEVFAAKVNPVLMAQAVRVFLANQRQGTASTKSRGEITASTRKIWRQKGTGRARHGALSAPIFVGGGVAFGPKPRDYSLQLPKKMKRKALASALTSKLHDNEVKVIDGLEKIEPKTKVMVETLTTIIGNGKQKTETLLIIPGKIENVTRAARNIKGVTIRPVQLLNTYEVLKSKTLLFMKDAISKLEESWIKQT